MAMYTAYTARRRADFTKKMYLTDASRWAAVQSRDRRADTHFVYCVRTTKIYCRPACPARLARRANTTFQATAGAAEAAGFRACKRCRPERGGARHDPQKAAVDEACRIIRESAEGRIVLRELASRVGFTEFHFHRVFKKIVGVTPREYANSTRFLVDEALDPPTELGSARVDGGEESARSGSSEGSMDTAEAEGAAPEESSSGLFDTVAALERFLELSPGALGSSSSPPDLPEPCEFNLDEFMAFPSSSSSSSSPPPLLEDPPVLLFQPSCM